MTISLQFWISGVNNNPFINILDKVKSIITQNSITFSELEDCRHEYLRLWMSGVFNDSRFTILNKWSQQWYQYQHSRQSGVNNNSKFYNIYWVRGLQAWISTNIYDYEWVVSSMTISLQFWMSVVNNDTSFSRQRWSQHNPFIKVGLITPNSITFTELEDCRHILDKVS